MSRKINHAYGLELPLVKVPHLPILKDDAPASTDRDFAIGDVWIHRVTADSRTAYAYGGLDSSGDAIWVLTGPGASDVDQLQGDAGGAISPNAGIVQIIGGTNIGTVGTNSGALNARITVNLDAAITLATSVTSPLYTAVADAVLEAAAANDVILRLGDNAGATFLRIQDSDDADLITVDSDGAVSALAGLTIAGAFAQTAGTFNVGQDNAANAINIGGGTTARAIGIGNSAAAHTITLGSVTGAGSLALRTGTGNFTLEGNVATTYAISNTGVNTGQVDIAGGTGARTINIGGGGTGAKTINIGRGASADVISIGTNDGAGSLAMYCGTGNFILDGAAATVYAIGATTVAGTITIGGTSQTGTITLGDSDGINIVEIGAGEGATTVNIAGGATSAKAVNIATGAVANTVAIGSASAGAITVDTAAGISLDAVTASNFTVTGAGVDLSLQGVGGAVNVTSTQAENDAIYIEASAANGGVQILAGTGGILIGNEADTSAITLGLVAPTASRTITIGGGTVVTAAVTDLIKIGPDGATTNANSIKEVDINVGTVAVGQLLTNIATGAVTSGTHTTSIATGNVTAGTVAVNIATGTGAQTLSIGSGAGAKTVTLGSTNTTSALTLQAGSGEITMTGTVKQIDAELMGQSGIYIPAFTQSSVAASAANTGGVPTGTTGDVNLISLQSGAVIEGFVVGAGQTILQPIMGASGLIVSADETVAEGMEYNFPYLQYTIGTSEAFAFELGLYINDMDGAAPYVFGFRKTEANNAVMADYTDYATIGMIAASSVTNIVTATELNSGGQTVTDTTDAWGGDGSYHVLRVLVSAAGVVTYTIDGVAPSSSAAFTFDNGDVVIPFIRIEHSASATDVAIRRMRIGYQA